MRILEVCLSPDFGGLEMAMKDCCYWLAEQPGCELHVAIQSSCRLERSLESLAAPTVYFNDRAGKFPFWKARRLAAYIARHRIDVVHLHWKFDLPLIALAKRLCRRKFAAVQTRHMNLPGRKHDPYHRYLYGSLDAFVAVTDYLADQARSNLPMDKSRIHRVHNGCAVPVEVPATKVQQLKQQFGIDGGFSVGLLGRISHYKGQHLLIEAVDQLRHKGKSVHAWIVGEPFDPDYLDELQEMVSERDLQDQIHFVGFHDKPHEILPCFDAVALTTKNETFGLVLIEAMHAGVAVIGSCDGGVPEIIDHESTGLLFETWNACSLADSIERLYDDAALRQRLASAGKRKAELSFDKDTQFGQTLDILKQVCPLPKTRRAA